MKHRIVGLFVLIASASVVCACSREAGGTVTVNGSSSLRQQPDRVSFSVGVETQAATVAEAYRANNTKLNTVLAALKQRGVQSAEIQTSNFSMTSRDDEGKPLIGFRVSNVVTVTRSVPGDLSELIQAAVAAGANQAGSARFFVADLKPLQSRSDTMNGFPDADKFVRPGFDDGGRRRRRWL